MQLLMNDLHDRYVYAVNAAVGENRMDLVRELNELYVEEALRHILASA